MICSASIDCCTDSCAGVQVWQCKQCEDAGAAVDGGSVTWERTVRMTHDDVSTPALCVLNAH